MSDKSNEICRNKLIEALLSEFVVGQLIEPDRIRVQAHLAECRPCRDTVSLLRSLAAYQVSSGQSEKVALMEERIEEHLSSEQLGALHAASESLSPEARSAFEDHVASCSRCHQELEFLRALESDLRRIQLGNSSVPSHESTSMFLRSSWLSIPRLLSAAVIVLCAASVAFFYRSRSSQLPSSPVMLRESLRGISDLPHVTRAVGNSVVLLELPISARDSEAMYSSILDNQLGEDTKVKVTRVAATSQNLLVSVDFESLPDGEYDLCVIKTRLIDSLRTELHFPFMLISNK